jgi:hypothetical protein
MVLIYGDRKRKQHGLQVIEQEGMDWINLSQDKDKW